MLYSIWKEHKGNEKEHCSGSRQPQNNFKISGGRSLQVPWNSCMFVYVNTYVVFMYKGQLKWFEVITVTYQKNNQIKTYLYLLFIIVNHST